MKWEIETDQLTARTGACRRTWMIVRTTRQHKPACGIQIIMRSNRIRNNKALVNDPTKKSINPLENVYSWKLYAAIAEVGMVDITTKSQRNVGNKDAHEWRVGSIHVWLRCCGSQVIVHLNMEMLDVTTEITCIADGWLAENMKMIVHCSANCGSDSNVISVIFIVPNNFWQCVMV